MPYKRNNQWIGQVRYNKQTKRKMFKTKKEAIDWERNAAKELESPQNEIPTVLLIDWATKYLQFAELKFVKSVWKEKHYLFQRFFKEVNPGLSVESLTSGKVLSFLQKQFQTRSGYTANTQRKNLVAAWNWGMKYLDPPLPGPNPCLVEKFPEVRAERYVPPVSHFWKVYEQAETKQDKIMLLAYLHLAARRTELFRLKWKDVDFANSRLRLFTRKRQNGTLEADWLPMTDDLYQELFHHFQNHKTQWVFPNPNTGRQRTERGKWMRRLFDKAKVKGFGLHAIRHLTASILAKANVPMIDIQAVLRHKKLSTIERYIGRIDSS
jgi:integrase